MAPSRPLLTVALTAFAAILLIPFLSARAQEPDAGQPIPTPESPARVQNPTPPSGTIGGCSAPGFLLARPWVTRDSQIEWWAWGLAYGSSVGLNLLEPGGRITPLGSFTVDALCEAAGTLSAGNRAAGSYTLIVTGQRSGGGAVELTAPVHIASVSRPSGAGIAPAAPFIPLTPVPCQAAAAVFC